MLNHLIVADFRNKAKKQTRVLEVSLDSSSIIKLEERRRRLLVRCILNIICSEFLLFFSNAEWFMNRKEKKLTINDT